MEKTWKNLINAVLDGVHIFLQGYGGITGLASLAQPATELDSLELKAAYLKRQDEPLTATEKALVEFVEKLNTYRSLARRDAIAEELQMLGEAKVKLLEEIEALTKDSE